MLGFTLTADAQDVSEARLYEADVIVYGVPVAMSSSHIAFGSIRMEPVFMVVGQSAATAASLAVDADVAVQDVDYATLKARLLEDGQVLAYEK